MTHCARSGEKVDSVSRRNRESVAIGRTMSRFFIGMLYSTSFPDKLLERFAQRRHGTRAGMCWSPPGSSLAATFPRVSCAPRLLGGDAPVTSNDEAPVGGLSSAAARPVVDDV